jgi:hypothetical protein
MTTRKSTEGELSGGRWIRSGGALSQDHRSLASFRTARRVLGDRTSESKALRKAIIVARPGLPIG